MRPPVSVVVPCYNEQAGLPALFARLDALLRDGGRGWRVLFVDDGSAHATFACLLSEGGPPPWAPVGRHPTNPRLRAPPPTRLPHSETPLVCTGDSDCTQPPS